MKAATSRKGQSLVEFGLSLPLILLAVFLFLDLGRAVYYYSAVTNAVREGARYSIIHLKDADYDTQYKSIIANYSVAVEIDPSTMTSTIGCVNNSCITITASYEFNPITPLLEQVFGGVGNTITIQSSSTMLLAPVALDN
jgi:Flp pilus assembly protein TadG